MHKGLHIRGLKLEVWVLDDKASNLLKSTMDNNQTTYELVPPHIHRANMTKRAIQTIENHFKARLASLDPNFPLSKWDRLIEQCELTLNLLRASRLNPKLFSQTL